MVYIVGAFSSSFKSIVVLKVSVLEYVHLQKDFSKRERSFRSFVVSTKKKFKN